MAEAPKTPPWGDDWMEANRRYWDAWTHFGEQPAERAAPGKPPEPGWAEAADRWWKVMTPPVPPGSRELFDRLMEQGKTFFRFGEAFAASATKGGGAFQSQNVWQQGLRAIAEQWGKAPFDFFQNQNQNPMERFFSAPALGFTRESQEQGQEMVRLTLAYQQALQAYEMVFQNLGTETFSRLQHRLGERAERQEPVMTLRALYDVWVDSSEEAYLELVSTESYAETYGKMVNALMALKHHGRAVMDQAVGAVGLPTRDGLATLQKRQQELRRETVALRRELAELRAQLDGLKGKPRRPATPRPRGARKKSRSRSKEA